MGAYVRFVSFKVFGTLTVIGLSVTAMPAAAHDLGIVPDGSQVAMRNQRGTAASPDSAEAVAAVERFRGALSRGDSATVLGMLAPDVIILESGDVETLAEYRRHHLPADIEFARAIPGTHTLTSAVVHGDAAWVSSTSITQGRMKDRAINSAGAELIVLSRRDGHSPWQIRAIHWSSHRRTS